MTRKTVEQKKAQNSASMKRLRDQRIAAGQCRRCGKPEVEDSTYCADHLADQRRWSRESMARLLVSRRVA